MNKWKNGSVIRDKETAKPFLVIHVYNKICTLLSDLSQTGGILPMGILLESEYDKFAHDEEFEFVKKDLLEDAKVLIFKELPKI